MGRSRQFRIVGPGIAWLLSCLVWAPLGRAGQPGRPKGADEIQVLREQIATHRNRALAWAWMADFAEATRELGEADRLFQVIKALAALYDEKHDYRTLVIDSLDWLERLIWADVCLHKHVESIEDIGYAKGYVFALTQWREFLEGLTALRNDKGMMVVLVAHARIERFVHKPPEDTRAWLRAQLLRRAESAERAEGESIDVVEMGV